MNEQKLLPTQVILQDMVAHLLIQKPEDPVPYIVSFLQDSQGTGAKPLSKEEKIELDDIREELKHLQEQKAKHKLDAQDDNSQSGSGSESDQKKKNDDDSSYDSEGDDEFLDDMPAGDLKPIDTKKQKEMCSTKRTSVSAEVFGKYHVKGIFKAVVIKKTPEQKDSIRNLLTNAFMFMGLDDKDMNTVIDAMESHHVKAGSDVITEGEAGNVLYIVESGEQKCYKVLSGTNTFLKDFGKGDVFGELALLYNAPRAATITAQTDSVMWQLDRNTFNNIVKEASSKKREKYENFLSSVEILQNMDHYERSKMADAVKEKKIAAGETIIKQGDAGEMFYILVEGTAKATLEANPTVSVKAYQSGDYFGERALLSGEPRAANVIAESDLKVITLDRKSFKRLLGPLDDILKRNLSNYQQHVMK